MRALTWSRVALICSYLSQNVCCLVYCFSDVKLNLKKYLGRVQRLKKKGNESYNIAYVLIYIFTDFLPIHMYIHVLTFVKLNCTLILSHNLLFNLTLYKNGHLSLYNSI